MKNDSSNHPYMDVENIRITYIPSKDRDEKEDWADSDVIRVQAYKGEGQALHMGAEIPVKSPTTFRRLIAALRAVYNEGIGTPLTEDATKCIHNNRFQRWQKITIEQLSYVNNLLLALSTASLGFVISMMAQKDVILSCWSKSFFDFGCFLLIVSITIGIFLAINRLRDFRTTARIARHKDNELTLGLLRCESNRLGKCSWCLFLVQIITFAVGILFLITSIAIIFHEKLF